MTTRPSVLKKRELVAIFMESPFYFGLRLRERMELLKRHRTRFSRTFRADRFNLSEINPRQAEETKTGKMTKIVVGVGLPAVVNPSLYK